MSIIECFSYVGIFVVTILVVVLCCTLCLMIEAKARGWGARKFIRRYDNAVLECTLDGDEVKGVETITIKLNNRPEFAEQKEENYI